MMESALREPWAGPAYSGLLIVGESFYGIRPEDDTPDLPTQVINKVIRGDIDQPFHERVARVVTGQVDGDVDVTAFWQGVAFWNFVPRAMRDAKEQPTRADFQAGHDAFSELLQSRLHPAPHHVLVLGQRVYREMPPFDGPTLSGIEHEDRGGWPGLYATHGDRFAVAMAINHPSSRGWSLRAWRPVVADFLAIPPSPPL